MNITATRPLRQIVDFDEDYLDNLLAAFDAFHDISEPDWTPPDPLDLPDPTLWRRARAEAARRTLKLVLRTNHCPDKISDYFFPFVETWALEVGK